MIENQIKKEVSESSDEIPDVKETIDFKQPLDKLDKQPVLKEDSLLEDFHEPRFKKLKKKSQIIFEQKIKKKISFASYFDVEAELGSDDENHDDHVKSIKDEDEENDQDEKLNQDLKDLIDENEIEYDEATLQAKFFSDMLDRDRQEIKKVILGPERNLLNAKRQRNIVVKDGEEFDDLPLQMRLSQYKSTSNDENENEFSEDLLFKGYFNLEKKLSNCENEEQAEELKEVLQEYQNKCIKKLSEYNNEDKKILNERIKENEKILENVINLNSDNRNANSNPLLLVKTISSASTKSDDKSKEPINKNFNTVSRLQYGAVFNRSNSFLHAMKHDKYFQKNEDIIANSKEISTANSKMCPIFSSNLNISSSMLSNKNANLTALFSKTK